MAEKFVLQRTIYDHSLWLLIWTSL